jgi:hypothetical protein
MNESLNYEPWIWVELIGFDNTQPDCGAAQYLARLDFVPRAISYLITAPDILHFHQSLENEVVFPPGYCSYYGHPFNAERERQVWTNHQLKTLTEALQARGIKVFLATFTTWMNDEYHKDEWVGDQQELLEVRRGGETVNAILPLKRFADGSFYEDFIIEKLTRVLSDYNFDGWHAADGWGPPRMPIYEGDFSDDMFAQFIAARNIQLPSHINATCQEYSQLRERADWIWQTQRREWIAFYVGRWASFYRKKSSAIHAIGKEIFINSSWTRDPLEAIYRYGIDYREIIAAGVDGIVTESAAGASDMEAESGSRLDNYVGALLLIRAAVPETKLVFLQGVKDVTEQWDLIHHTPTVLEKEIASLANIYLQTENGTLRRCADGFVVCLGDGISAEEWRWLQARWGLAFGEMPTQLLGATLLWSDAMLDAEIDDFSAHRGATTHRLLYELTERGAPIQSAVRLGNLQNARGALLVLNAHLLPEDEKAGVLRYTNGPIIFIERDAQTSRLKCRVFESARETQTLESKQSAVFAGDKTAIEEPITFLQNLEMQLVEDAFLKTCVRLITKVSDALEVESGEDFISVQAMQLAQNKVRVILKNSRLAYSRPTIETKRKIASLKICSEFPYAKLAPDESRFSVKVPGRGATILDVVFANEKGSA